MTVSYIPKFLFLLTLLFFQPHKLYSAVLISEKVEHDPSYLTSVVRSYGTPHNESFTPTVETLDKAFITSHQVPKKRRSEIGTVPSKIFSVGGLLKTSEIVINPSDDRRTKVGSTTDFPFSAHGQVMIYFGDSSFVGTGALVGPYHVLTAGHNVFDHEDNYGWATKVEFTPARQGDTTYFETTLAARIFTVKGWLEGKEEERDHYDIAMLILTRTMYKENI